MVETGRLYGTRILIAQRTAKSSVAVGHSLMSRRQLSLFDAQISVFDEAETYP